MLFTINRNTFSDHISTIRSGIEDLEKLTDQNVSLEPYRHERTQVRLLGLLRELSMGLHRALKRSLSCACVHTLNLKLTTRPSDVMHAENESKMLQELDLHLLLSLAEAITAGGHHVIDDKYQAGLRFQAVPAKQREIAVRSNSTSQLPSILPPAKSKGKRVAFQSILLNPLSSSTSTLVQTATATSLGSIVLPATATSSNLEPKQIDIFAKRFATHKTSSS